VDGPSLRFLTIRKLSLYGTFVLTDHACFPSSRYHPN
jgi:hypothetical protein